MACGSEIRTHTLDSRQLIGKHTRRQMPVDEVQLGRFAILGRLIWLESIFQLFALPVGPFFRPAFHLVTAKTS
jgi:hypothetical protein